MIEDLYSRDEYGEEDDFTELEGTATKELIISLHAITGLPTPRTMRVQGMLGNHQITMLMDSGSTHNFLNSRLAKRHGLQPTKVTVANGEKLECKGLCHGLLLWLLGEPFVIDFFLLPLEGCEGALGTQWQQMLGPIWWDFARLLMKFSWKGREISLKGLKLLNTDW
jgi:hypothetical protein